MLTFSDPFAVVASSPAPDQPAFPTATVTFLLITAVLSGLQFAYPVIRKSMQRAPDALHGEWWRLVTPLLIERGSWTEIAGNLVSIVLAGVVAERFLGSRRWLVFYVFGGLVGEVAGLMWRPHGAGSSVAVCGLLGALAVSLLSRASWTARALGAAVLCTGVALTVAHNLHGPPVIVAMMIAGGMRQRDQRLGWSRGSNEQ
jgi:rhomboid protease GluP